MKKFNLNDIENKNIFEVPDEYFKDLPSIIQNKAIGEEKQSVWEMAFANPILKFAIPSVLILAIFLWKGDPSGNDVAKSTEMLLAEVSVEEIHNYLLEETEITHSELAEIASEVTDDINFEKQSILDDETLEDIDLSDLESLM